MRAAQPNTASIAVCATNKPTHDLMETCAHAVGHPHTHTTNTQTYVQSAVAQLDQADSPQHLSGAAPKEKLNSFNRGRAVNGRLISACVFIS